MRLTFLGTGTSQGVPVIGCQCEVCRSDDPEDKRLRSSLMIEAENLTATIDIGPDFRQQMLREDVRDLDAVVITHEHMDHVAGLDEIRAFNFIRQKKIPVYCTEKVQRRLREQFSYVFNNPDYPGIPQIEFVTLTNNTPFRIKGVEFIPVKVMHGSMPLFGFRIGNFTYITDANYIDEAEMQKIKGTEILVLNALHQKPHHSHYSLEEAIEVSNEIGARQTYFTHISHQMGLSQEVKKLLPEGKHLAYDGLKIELIS